MKMAVPDSGGAGADFCLLAAAALAPPAAVFLRRKEAAPFPSRGFFSMAEEGK